jgi:predicted signal transduction protein with EAL and GGDEF domain
MTSAAAGITRWLERLEALHLGAKVLAVSTLFVAIAVTDAVTGLDLTLRALYLLPVGATAWLLGRGAGFVVSALSVCVSAYYDVAFGLARTQGAFVFSDAAVRLAVYLAAAVLLAQMHAVQARLRELAQTDPLTGLYNRRGFRRIAEREIERSKRTRSSLTLVHLDLDGFKALNDRLGHAEGDDVLVAVGHSLKASRAIDVASRLGRSARTRR